MNDVVRKKTILIWLRAHRAYLLNVGLLSLVYVLTAKLGLSLAYTTPQITSVWPPSGIALAAILVLGFRYWPGIALGALVANALSNEPLLVAAAIAVGNTLEALAGAFLFTRFAQSRNSLDTSRDAGALVAAVLVSSVVAATIGTVSLALGGLIAWHNYWSNWAVWLIGDSTGGLLLASLLLVYLDRRSYEPARERLLEGGVLLAGLFATSMVVFTAKGTYALLHIYLLFPFMVWAALRFMQLGVMTASLEVAATAVWATVNDLGPLAKMPMEQALIQLLVIVVVISETSLLLAMAIRGRAVAMAALRKQAQQLEQLEAQLREANLRMTDILASVLDDGKTRHRAHEWRTSKRWLNEVRDGEAAPDRN